MFPLLISKIRIAPSFFISIRWFAVEFFFISTCIYLTMNFLKSTINYYYKDEMPELYFDIEQFRYRELNEVGIDMEKIKNINLFKSDVEHILIAELFNKNIEDRQEIKEDEVLYNSPKYYGKVKLVGVIKSTNSLKSISIIEINKKQSSYFLRDTIEDERIIIVRIFNDRIIVKKDSEYFSIILNES